MRFILFVLLAFSQIANAENLETIRARLNVIWIFRNDVSGIEQGQDIWPSETTIDKIREMQKSKAVRILSDNQTAKVVLFYSEYAKDPDAAMVDFDIACILFTPSWVSAGPSIRLLSYNIKQKTVFPYRGVWIGINHFDYNPDGVFSVEFTRKK